MDSNFLTKIGKVFTGEAIAEIYERENKASLQKPMANENKDNLVEPLPEYGGNFRNHKDIGTVNYNVFDTKSFASILLTNHSNYLAKMYEQNFEPTGEENNVLQHIAEINKNYLALLLESWGEKCADRFDTGVDLKAGFGCPQSMFGFCMGMGGPVEGGYYLPPDIVQFCEWGLTHTNLKAGHFAFSDEKILNAISVLNICISQGLMPYFAFALMGCLADESGWRFTPGIYNEKEQAGGGKAGTAGYTGCGESYFGLTHWNAKVKFYNSAVQAGIIPPGTLNMDAGSYAPPNMICCLPHEILCKLFLHYYTVYNGQYTKAALANPTPYNLNAAAYLTKSGNWKHSWNKGGSMWADAMDASDRYVRTNKRCGYALGMMAALLLAGYIATGTKPDVIALIHQAAAAGQGVGFSCMLGGADGMMDFGPGIIGSCGASSAGRKVWSNGGNMRDLGGPGQGGGTIQLGCLVRGRRWQRDVLSYTSKPKCLVCLTVSDWIAKGLINGIRPRYYAHSRDEALNGLGHVVIYGQSGVVLYDTNEHPGERMTTPFEGAVLVTTNFHATYNKGLVYALTMYWVYTDHLVYFHCDAGRDRTGEFAQYLEAVLGCSRDFIANDHAMTGLPEPVGIGAHYKHTKAERLGKIEKDLPELASSYIKKMEHMGVSSAIINRFISYARTNIYARVNAITNIFNK